MKKQMIRDKIYEILPKAEENTHNINDTYKSKIMNTYFGRYVNRHRYDEKKYIFKEVIYLHSSLNNIYQVDIDEKEFSIENYKFL